MASDGLRYLMMTLRREFATRDQYQELEKYLKEAPPAVQHDLELLHRKISDRIEALEQKAKITSQSITAALRRGGR